MGGNPAKEPPPLSAPDLIGPGNINQPHVTGPRQNRRRRSRPYSHARFEIDLAPPEGAAPEHHGLGSLLGAVTHPHGGDGPDLSPIAAAALHALASRQFRWLVRWQEGGDGWLPVPGEKSETGPQSPVKALISQLEGGDSSPAAKAGTFSVEVSDHQGNRAEFLLRRAPKFGHHSMTLDLRGKWTKDELDGAVGSLKDRLPVARAELTKFQYADS